MSHELDIETLTRPGGIVPVNVETTAALVRKILDLHNQLVKIRTAADRVVWFDWSGNDPDAYAAIIDLRSALTDETEK